MCKLGLNIWTLAPTASHVQVLQDSFKCNDGTYILWEVSVVHGNARKKRGHVKAEVMTKAYAAHPIAGYPGKSRVVVVTQVSCDFSVCICVCVFSCSHRLCCALLLKLPSFDCVEHSCHVRSAVRYGLVHKKADALLWFILFYLKSVKVARRNTIPLFGGGNAPATQARGALNNFEKLKKQADQFHFSDSGAGRGEDDVKNERRSAGSSGGGARGSGSRDLTIRAKQKAEKLTLDDFNLLAVIGRGGYGKVFQVTYKKTGEVLALKAVKKGFMSREQANRTMTERSIMAQVRTSVCNDQNVAVFHRCVPPLRACACACACA